MAHITPGDVVDSMQVLPALMHQLMGRFEPETDLNPTETQALMMLAMHDGEPMSACSRQIGVQKGSFTAVADKLEAKGLVERRSDETDRRKVTLALTTQGREQASRMREVFETHMAKRLSGLSAGQLDRLHQALTTLGELAKELEQTR